MIIRPRSVPLLFCALAFVSIPAFAQSVARRSSNSTALGQASGPIQNANSSDQIASEIALLRKSVDNLNTRLREISQELFAPDSKQNDNDRIRRISTNFDLLTRAEERAEVLRKQLIELIEKETAFKTRLTQLDEDMRPENIERALSGIGTTRTPELRDNRRRVLENERRGVESLLNITSQSRVRLEEDVRQADQLVAKLRLRLFPLIEREIEKLNPN